jgi:amino acid adenylation domain-containing protein
MSNTMQQFANLSVEEKRTLLAQMLQKKARESKIFPLSYAQQRLWFLDQLEAGHSAYNMASAILLSGPLDLLALQRTFSEIVRRHQILRTTFSLLDDQPVQVVAPPREVALPLLDISHWPQEERMREAERVASEEAHRSFDLAEGPLLRVSVVRLGEGEHVVLVTMHHIISDGWSMSIFVGEVARLYEGYVRGEEEGGGGKLKELGLQYADYAVWQREWLSGEVLEAELRFWKQQLEGAPATLNLHTDWPRPKTQEHLGASQWLELGKDLTAAANQLCEQEGVTFFMMVLAVLNLLLYRYTNQEDIVIGSPISGRHHPETEGLIGFFVNTLVLRTNLSGNPTFRELLGRVREMCLGAYAHQDMPFEKLVEHLQPERNLNHHPLFDILINRGNTPIGTLTLPDLKFQSLDNGTPNSKFSMTFYVHDGGLMLVYQQALFTAERMACLLQQFRYLLEQIVAAPGSSIRSYSLVTPESRSLLPDPSVILPERRYELVHKLFLDWARETPEQPAIILKERAWTYGELAEAVQTLARTLLAQGLERGDAVVVLGPSSFGLIASMMASPLSGGVLLVIDRKLPVNRLRAMVREAGAKHILYSGPLRDEDRWIEELSPVHIVYLDAENGRPVGVDSGGDHAAIEFPELTPDDAAYISFTSGTTGVPKGILNCHKGLSHFVHWQRTTFEIGPHDRVCQITNFSFEVIFREVFLPLTSGAVLCLPEDHEDPGADRILNWLERDRISVLHTVPTLAQSWLANVPPGISLQHLRYTFMAGEPLTDSLVHLWREAFPKSGSIINLYGPSETTLAKCFYRVPEEGVLPGVQPVGSPLPLAQALVLSEAGHLCGIEEPGEIVIRTPYRSRGYISAFAEKQRRFVPNHFREDKGDLLYYTGDRGRYRVDGTLEILGRLDHQVKLHGVRIELGEVETVLRQHAKVRECVVVAREDSPGDKRLAAYVVYQQTEHPTVSDLRNFLETELPKYSIPSAFIVLEALPYTRNGKVDRQALPIPDQFRPTLEETFVRPRDITELQLVQIWEVLLKVHPIGINDNFFHLGGHSLLAVGLMAQIEKRFNQKLPLSTLFECPTIEHLAQILRGKTDVRQRSPLVAIQPDGSQPPFFCVHPAGGNVLCYTDLARHLGRSQPFYGLQTPGYEGEQEPYTNIEDLAAHYVEAVRALRPQGPYLLGGWSMGATVAYEMAQQLQAQGQQVSLLAMLDGGPPPALKEQYPEYDDVTLLLQACGDDLVVSPEELEGLGIEEQLNYIIAKAKEAEMMPPDIGLEQVRAYIKIYQANAKARLNYTPQPYPGRVVVLRASEPPTEGERDITFGWENFASEGVEAYKVPGRHGNMVREPHAEALARRLNSCIEKALNRDATEAG